LRTGGTAARTAATVAMETWTKLQSSLDSASDPSHNSCPRCFQTDCFLIIWGFSNRLFFRQLGARNTYGCNSGQWLFQPKRSLDSISLCPVLAEMSADFGRIEDTPGSLRTMRPSDPRNSMSRTANQSLQVAKLAWRRAGSCLRRRTRIGSVQSSHTGAEDAAWRAQRVPFFQSPPSVGREEQNPLYFTTYDATPSS
jgi:hypothetical protein